MMAAMRANTKRASCPNFPDLLGHPERRLPESKDLARSPARLSAHEWQPKRRVQEQEDRFDSQPNEIENFCTRGGPREILRLRSRTRFAQDDRRKPDRMGLVDNEPNGSGTSHEIGAAT